MGDIHIAFVDKDRAWSSLEWVRKVPDKESPILYYDYRPCSTLFIELFISVTVSFSWLSSMGLLGFQDVQCGQPFFEKLGRSSGSDKACCWKRMKT